MSLYRTGGGAQTITPTEYSRTQFSDKTQVVTMTEGGTFNILCVAEYALASTYIVDISFATTGKVLFTSDLITALDKASSVYGTASIYQAIMELSEGDTVTITTNSAYEKALTITKLA